MAYINMEVAPTTKGSERNFAYEKTVSLTSVANSAWILIPSDVKFITYILSVGGGVSAGKVQITNSKISVVKSGSGIIAIDWPSGAVTVNTSDASRPVTAVRLAQTAAGTTKLEIRGQ